MTRQPLSPAMSIADEADPGDALKSRRERDPRNDLIARSLRVTVSGPELFANRTVTLFRGMGMDARRPRSVDDFGALRSKIVRDRDSLATDVFLNIYGTRRLGRSQRLLARIGVPTVIAWVGTDVLRNAPKASRDVVERAWHWCVAPWLRDELAEVGIEAPVLRLTPPQIPGLIPAFPAHFTILAYAIDGRGDLYGLDFVLDLARRRPDVRFLLLGSTPTDGLPENVKALGWVSDAEAVMAKTTLYVRPTSHDGLSNLVLEALVSGRYVLWTYPFPGVERADTLEHAAALIDDLYRRNAEGTLAPNDEGRGAVLEMFEPAEVRDCIVLGLAGIADQRWTRPPARVQRGIAFVVLRSLRAIFRADRAWKRVPRRGGAG
jgi:hypothetical protein